jgi:RES domain-containing protein
MDPDEVVDKWGAEVQPLIEYCYNCQPWESGEIAAWVLGERTDLTDVFDMAEVPEDEELRMALAASLRCLNCGTTGFNLATEVGIRGEFEKRLEAQLNAARAAYRPQIEEFQAFLERTPMLGLKHELGRRLLSMVESEELPHREISGEHYRARLSNGPRVLASGDLGAPPVGKALDARFSHAGQRVLYLASSKEVAMAETLGDSPSGLVWLQRFEVKRIPRILDLSIDAEQLSPEHDFLIALLDAEAFARAAGEDESTWKPGYLLPRFVADCAKLCGYRGICYPSVRTHGTNIVVFDEATIESNVSTLGEPEIVPRRPPRKPKF